MKHFGDARRDVLAAAALLQQCSSLCLIWDLRGELRVLVKTNAGVDTGRLTNEIHVAFAAAADAFWSGVTWIWSPDVRLSEGERMVYEEAWRLSRLVQPGAPEVRELDRHLSKETWFGEPIPPPWPQNEHTPPILSFYSFKGGVGRTTALVAFAIQLARAGKRVAVVDLDLEAPGVGTLLLSGAGTTRFGVVDYIVESGVAAGRLDIAEYFHLCDDQQIVGGGPPIVVVPAGTLDQLYLEKLARIDYQGVLGPSMVDAGKVLRDMLQALRRERQVDYILLDARSGLHDIGGLALNGVAHLDVIFGLDSEQSWQGLGVIIRHLGLRRTERGLAHQPFALAFAMAPTLAHPDRDASVGRFRDRAHELLSELYYDEEPDVGWSTPMPDDVWPVPAIDDATEPHFAIPIGFNGEIQRAVSIAAVSDLLTQGDYEAFGRTLLERIGRTSA